MQKAQKEKKKQKNIVKIHSLKSKLFETNYFVMQPIIIKEKDKSSNIENNGIRVALQKEMK